MYALGPLVADLQLHKQHIVVFLGAQPMRVLRNAGISQYDLVQHLFVGLHFSSIRAPHLPELLAKLQVVLELLPRAGLLLQYLLDQYDAAVGLPQEHPQVLLDFGDEAVFVEPLLGRETADRAEPGLVYSALGNGGEDGLGFGLLAARGLLARLRDVGGVCWWLRFPVLAVKF